MFYTKMETKGTPNSFKSRGVHCARIRVCGFAPSRAPPAPGPGSQGHRGVPPALLLLLLEFLLETDFRPARRGSADILSL